MEFPPRNPLNIWVCIPLYVLFKDISCNFHTVSYRNSLWSLSKNIPKDFQPKYEMPLCFLGNSIQKNAQDLWGVSPKKSQSTFQKFHKWLSKAILQVLSRDFFQKILLWFFRKSSFTWLFLGSLSKDLQKKIKWTFFIKSLRNLLKNAFQKWFTMDFFRKKESINF